MSAQDSSKNILSLMLIPLVFAVFISVFVLSNSGAEQGFPPHEYIVGIASIIAVSVVSIVCLFVAAIAAQPRYQW